MTSITVDTILDVLRIRERRIIVATLSTDEELPLSEVVGNIAMELGIDQERAKINATHTHLPVLEGYDIAGYDEKCGRVERSECYDKTLEYLQAIEQV